MIKVGELNALSAAEFARLIGPVFENSPWIAEHAFARHPFGSVSELHAALCEIVRNATAEQQTALIRAHPDLVGRAVLTSESHAEQQTAGLGNLSPEEMKFFQNLNREYRERFGFPFVICARLHRKEAILRAFPERLQNSREKEIETALAEICKIAELRLRDLVQ